MGGSVRAGLAPERGPAEAPKKFCSQPGFFGGVLPRGWMWRGHHPSGGAQKRSLVGRPQSIRPLLLGTWAGTPEVRVLQVLVKMWLGMQSLQCPPGCSAGFHVFHQKASPESPGVLPRAEKKYAPWSVSFTVFAVHYSVFNEHLLSGRD